MSDRRIAPPRLEASGGPTYKASTAAEEGGSIVLEVLPCRLASRPRIAPTLVGQLWPSREEHAFAVIRTALLVLARLAAADGLGQDQRPVLSRADDHADPRGPADRRDLWPDASARPLSRPISSRACRACRSSPGPLRVRPIMAGPTGGFLVGFLAAAIVTGYLADHGWDSVLGPDRSHDGRSATR